MKMTNKQRGSLHVWLDQWAFALREEGVTMDLIVRTLATRSIEAKPTKMLLKELVWKPVQEKLAAVMSSEKMETTDLDYISEALSKWSAQEFGVAAPPWPCEETQMREQLDDVPGFEGTGKTLRDLTLGE
tara:strand:- start:265 stop:654 length:390 start_codon:yes stop_codon:yes gene_type:complete